MHHLQTTSKKKHTQQAFTVKITTNVQKHEKHLWRYNHRHLIPYKLSQIFRGFTVWNVTKCNKTSVSIPSYNTALACYSNNEKENYFKCNEEIFHILLNFCGNLIKYETSVSAENAQKKIWQTRENFSAGSHFL